jgi:PKD repeat protein
MATIQRTLYNRYNPGDGVGPNPNQNRFLLNESGGSPGQPFSAANAGDTLAATLYFLDDVGGSNPFRFHRYAGAQVEINLFAAGNATFYGIATSVTELAPTTGITVGRLQFGTNFDVEKQTILFNGTPRGGTFRLVFQLGVSSSESTVNSPPIRAAFFADLTFPYNVSAATIQDSLRALTSYYAYDRPGNQVAGPVGLSTFTNVSMPEVAPIVTAITGGFQIDFGSLNGGKNCYLKSIPLIVAEDFNISYAYGWTISVPLTDPNFINLFRTANAPAYLDVVLRPNGAGTSPAILTGQLPLIASDPGGVPTANFSANVLSGTAPLAVQFVDASTNSPTSWAWNFGDGATSTAQNPSHTYSAVGQYNVTLTATNANGSDGETKNQYITVDAPAGGVGETTDAAYVDGNWSTPQPVDCPESEQPFPEKPTALILRQKYWQWRLYWSPAPLSMPCPFYNGAVLIRETPLRSLGGGNLVEWERVFATVPGDIVDYEIVNYVWQWLYSVGGVFRVNTIALTRLAQVTRSFYHTTNPISVSVARLPRVVVQDNTAAGLDGFANLSPGANTIACDDSFVRWEGNIWMKTNKRITI